MTKMILLLRTFLNGHLEPEEFVDLFFPVASVLQDMGREVVKSHPSFDQAFQALASRLISLQEFEMEKAKFIASLSETEFNPFSKEAEALDHLWVEADAYRSDPLERDPGLHIGDEELRRAVRETLVILEK